MVPDLALGIFATATSTGDLWGDGDAVGFPVASKIIPAVEELLIAQVSAKLKCLFAQKNDHLPRQARGKQKGGT